MRHLIHIGYPKTGSSYLHRWFSTHPQILHSPNGLAGFAGTADFTAAAAHGKSDRAWYVTSAVSLASPGPGVGRGLGWDVDSPYRPNELREARERVCAQLADIFPNAYVLMVTRGFRSMILSTYSEYLRVGGLADFDRFVRLIIENPWNYDCMLALYRRAFCGRVIVLPFELLAGNPRLFRSELERRLEISSFEFPDEKVRPSLSSAELLWYPRVRSLYRGNAFVRFQVEPRIINRLGPLFSVLNGIYRTPGPSADAIPDEIIDRMRGHTKLLKQEPPYYPYGQEYLFQPAMTGNREAGA